MQEKAFLTVEEVAAEMSVSKSPEFATLYY